MTAIESITIPDTDVERSLKQSPFRDLCLRAVVFVAIATVATFGGIKHSDALTYLEGLGSSLAPMLNIMGSIALLLCIPALMTKDLEATLSNERYRAMTRSRLAGLSRRLASDLTLWTFGALVTLLTSLVIVVTQIPLQEGEVAAAAGTALWISVLIVVVSVANIQIRLPRPSPLACLHPGLIAFVYVAGFVFITYFGVVK